MRDRPGGAAGDRGPGSPDRATPVSAGHHGAYHKRQGRFPNKPTVQAEFLRLFNAGGPIPTPQMKRNYLNFYGNLMKASDEYLVKILDTLEARGLLENTLVVATGDHGEMGTAHGGLRQKNFNFYTPDLHGVYL